MTAEPTVLHGPLPSAHGSTASPTPRSGDDTFDSASISSSSGSGSSSRRRRDSRREHDKDDASRRSSSFPYRDIIKSVLSHVVSKAETPSSSSSSSSSSHNDMKDKQVEDVVRGLAMEEWNSRWLDELVAKVKGELNDGPEHGDDASVSDEGAPTPSSPSSTASPKETMKRYQPTVEDYNEDEEEPSDFEYGFTPTISLDDTHQPLTRTTSQLSSSSADSSCSSTPSNSSASPASADSLPTPPSSVSSEESASSESCPPSRPTVRFQPPVIHYITEPPTPDVELEAEPELHRSHSLPLHLTPSVAERETPSWTMLFNERDEPTPALSRFLRGLANHIIADYSPTDSLVITPDKLLRFYSRYKLDNEFFPFQRVFDTRYHKSTRGISFLFSDLRCEHHLVQPAIDAKPCVPALTPAGFEDWMTLMIRAFPDREAKRLDLVLADVSLLADDSRHARQTHAQRLLPRELPRELFPERGHARVFDLLASSFAEWNSITAVVVVPPEAVVVPPQLHASYALSPSLPCSLQKLPPAASKALKEDTRRHKDACYIDQARLRPSSLIYPSSPASPTSSFSTTSSIPSEAKPPHDQQSSTSSSSSSSSSSKHRSSRSRERDSRHRTSDRSSRRSRERSPRRHHKSRRHRASSPDSTEQRYGSVRGDERRRERERRGSG